MKNDIEKVKKLAEEYGKTFHKRGKGKMPMLNNYHTGMYVSK